MRALRRLAWLWAGAVALTGCDALQLTPVGDLPPIDHPPIQEARRTNRLSGSAAGLSGGPSDVMACGSRAPRALLLLIDGMARFGFVRQKRAWTQRWSCHECEVSRRETPSRPPP